MTSPWEMSLNAYGIQPKYHIIDHISIDGDINLIFTVLCFLEAEMIKSLQFFKVSSQLVHIKLVVTSKLFFELQDEVEAEMRRLKQELKQTMDMYSTACKEALSAREKA